VLKTQICFTRPQCVNEHIDNCNDADGGDMLLMMMMVVVVVVLVVVNVYMYLFQQIGFTLLFLTTDLIVFFSKRT